MAMTYSHKADWLDVTTPPGSETSARVLSLLSCFADDIRVSPDQSKTTLRLSSGSVVLDNNDRFSRISASGAALTAMRMHSIFDDYLFSLSESSHRVTRLDVAYDTEEDFPKVLHRIRSKYPKGKASLSRKSLRLKEILSKRDSDNVSTGTVYFGHRSKARVVARVYDKQEESFANRGETIGARTRYELTVRSEMGATLRDAHSPEPLFWHFMSPTVLKKPKSASSSLWLPDEGLDWSSRIIEVDHARRLRYAVENSALFDYLLQEADKLSEREGRVYLARLLTNKIGRKITFGG